MAQKEYIFPAPIVETQSNRAEITLVTINPLEDKVSLVIRRRFDEQVVGTETLVVPLANLDIFINNTASFPGDGFLEKVLRFFAAGGIFPAGGTVGEV